VVDRIIEMDYSVPRRRQIYQKYFGADLTQTHNFRAGPFLHYMYAIEEAASGVIVYFDSDMLLFQEPGYSWIDEGRELLKQRQEVIAVNPLPGPPTGDGALYQIPTYELDSWGFYRFNRFSSRVFLIDQWKFDRLLPLRAEFAGAGRLGRWEVIVSNRLSEAGYVRADLASPKAWTLHPVNHSRDFLAALPGIIEKVEAGWFPPEQAGHYDLKLGAWMKYLNLPRSTVNAATVSEVFEDYLPGKLKQNAGCLASGAKIKFSVSDEGGGVWVVDHKHPSGVVSRAACAADCSVTLSADVLLDMVNGDLNPSLAVKYGWVQVEGDLEALTELVTILTARR
jgi:hypothetical protein